MGGLRKLNLGCGHVAPSDWINVDRSPTLLLRKIPWLAPVLRSVGLVTDHQLARWPPNVVRADITKPLRWPDGAMEAVYASHTLEHLYLGEVHGVLKEIVRVLERGGRLRLAFPDPERLAADLVANRGGPGTGRKFNEALQTHPFDRPRGLGRVRQRVGASWHRWQPTRDLVVELLEEAGFETIEERAYRDSAIPGIEAVEHRDDGWFVEATAP